MKHIGIIPRNRLQNIPENLRVAHEFCFFVHDECVRALVEYENAEAHVEPIRFRKKSDRAQFEKITTTADAIDALRKLGYHCEAKKIILNTITMAMISDCLHHVYESLICFEKRKSIVGFNILRKPLKESLLYLAWMYGDQDEFYDNFTKGDAKYLSQSTIGHRRMEIFSRAIRTLEYGNIFDSETIEDVIYSRQSKAGFELFFQHAVHLITVRHIELKTTEENFNFIFKNPLDDDIYDLLYENLPYILLFMAHIMVAIFDRMKKMDCTSKILFYARTAFLFNLITASDKGQVLTSIRDIISQPLHCLSCFHESSITEYNAARILAMSEFRCANCRRINPFIPFSYPEISAEIKKAGQGT